MKMFKEIIRLQEFEKEIKRFKKKYRTIEDDLEVFIRYSVFPFLKLEKNNKGIVRISDIGIKHPEIYKARKFACKAMKGKGSRTGFRIIFAYHKKEDKIDFVEIYMKSENSIEDRKRIKRYYLKQEH